MEYNKHNKIGTKNNILESDLILEIPKMIANKELPDPVLLEYYKNEQNRIIWIEDAIDNSLSEIFKQIIRYNREDANIPIDDRKPIKIFINSEGGALDITMSFIEFIKLSKTPIWTINVCMAYSAAGLIFMAGHKRFALTNSWVLIHSGSGCLSGSFEQTEEQMKNYKIVIKNMKKFILDNTKIDQKLLSKNSAKDWYLSAEQAKQFGVFDEIISDIDVLL